MITLRVPHVELQVQYLCIHGSASQGFNPLRRANIWKKFQKVPKRKTWICCPLETINIAFTFYLQLFTQYLHCIYRYLHRIYIVVGIMRTLKWKGLSAQSSVVWILCDPVDWRPPQPHLPCQARSSAHGILQATVLGWVTFSFGASSQPRDGTPVSCLAGGCVTIWAPREALWVFCVCESLSYVQLFAIPWSTACRAPLSMGFSRHKY